MSERNMEKNIVWLNPAERIASFHPIDGYQRREFTCREFFMDFLHSLQNSGYRFQ